ncbi:hypothetical protein [Pedobacter aquatilis]|nr:hypothetical protein [Pedobacter aquatilis]
MRKDIKNQNQKFRPVLFARKPANICGDNKSPSTAVPTNISGIYS